MGAIVGTLVAPVSDATPRRKPHKGAPVTIQLDQPGERNEYNFVADPSFENVISEWENESDADGGTGPLWTIEHDGVDARSGTGYAKLEGDLGTTRKLWNLRVFDVVPEQIFHMEAFSTGSGIFDIGVRWYDEDGGTISDDIDTFATGGRNVVRVFPPSDAVRGQIFLDRSLFDEVDSTVDDVFAAQFPSHLAPLAETSPVATDSDSSTRTNTAYGDLADTANSPAVDFIAPPNGRVEVTVSAFMKSGATFDKSCMGYQVIDNTDSSVFQDAAETRSACTTVSNNLTLTRPAEVSGLVPGRSYTARAKYKSAGTITAADRRISVRPQLGVL